MIVIFDIDDCLMPWAEKVHQECMAAGLNPENKPWTQWHMWEDYGCQFEQWLEVVNGLVVPGGIYHSEAYPGAVEAVKKLSEQGHEIHLVTARGFHDHKEQIREWTHEWVKTNDIPGELWFAQDKGVVAHAVRATHAIDDRIENAESMLDVGVDVYLMNQPHNLARPYLENKRVNSVEEFVNRILS